MTPIKAVDAVFVAAPIQHVWGVIEDVPSYPSWWPASLGITVLSAGEEALGAEVEIATSGSSRFRCRVTEVKPPNRMAMEYYGGLVSGTGVWTLTHSTEGTKVTYHLDAVGKGWLIKVLGIFMDLGAVHSRMMKGVLNNLQEKLQTQSQIH